MIIDIINWRVIADFCNTHVAVYHNDLEPEVELIHVSLHVHNLKEKFTSDKSMFIQNCRALYGPRSKTKTFSIH